MNEAGAGAHEPDEIRIHGTVCISHQIYFKSAMSFIKSVQQIRDHMMPCTAMGPQAEQVSTWQRLSEAILLEAKKVQDS